jgi:tetratricopeptide (TPR) repeat protein
VTGDLRSAAEQQEYAVDADLSNTGRWRSIMSLYGQLNDIPTAISTGKRALEFIPDDPVVNLLMGANYQMTEDYDQALGYFRKALTLTDENDNSARSQIVASIGDIYYAREMPDSAFVYYKEAVSLDPENLLALNNFAYYLAENEQDLDMAERYSAICVRANSENDTAIDTYAWIFYKKKDYVKAKEWIDRALELEAENPQADVLNHAGDIYFMNREVAKAVEFWEQALKLDPDNKTLKKKIRQRSPFVE